MLAAAILAAGESQRMGQPKALVPFQGLSFVEHLIAATRHARIGLTRIVLGAGANDIRAKLAVDSASIVVNPDWPKGQLSSIHAAIRGRRRPAALPRPRWYGRAAPCRRTRPP